LRPLVCFHLIKTERLPLNSRNLILKQGSRLR
jgi:hypothetical protein